MLITTNNELDELVSIVRYVIYQETGSLKISQDYSTNIKFYILSLAADEMSALPYRPSDLTSEDAFNSLNESWMPYPVTSISFDEFINKTLLNLYKSRSGPLCGSLAGNAPAIPSARYIFTPASMTEFSTTAANLAWFINLPQFTTREILARIYGYPNEEQLMQGVSSSHTPGPFDKDYWFSETTDADSLDIYITIERISYPRKVLSILNRLGHEVPDYRRWEMDSLGLFHPPHVQKFLFDIARGKIDVIEGNEKAGYSFKTTDYAFVKDADGDEQQLHFTFAGKAIYDACISLLPEKKHIDIDELDAVFEKLLPIFDRHPRCPIPRALWVIWVGDRFNQGHWISYCDEISDGITPEFISNIKWNAQSLIDDASIAVDGFVALSQDSILVEDIAVLPDHFSVNNLWPKLLFSSGCIALNSGDIDLAEEWFSQCYCKTNYENLSPHYYISSIMINREEFSSSSYFKDESDLWGYLVMMADAILINDEKLAATYLTCALCRNPELLSVISPDVKIDFQYKLVTTMDKAENAIEFFYKTKLFWEKNAKYTSWIIRVCHDSDVICNLREYHRHRESKEQALVSTCEAEYFMSRSKEIESDIIGAVESTLSTKIQ